MKHRALIWGAILAAAACQTSKENPYEGETHWLGECGSDSDCAPGECLCGVCTKPCNGDGACAEGPRAGCFKVASPGLTGRCAVSDVGDAAGICLALCGGSSECPLGTECLNGACVASAAERNGSMSDVGSPVASPDPRDYLGEDPTMSFDTPVEVVPPSRIISGPADALLGEWREADCGPNFRFYAGCLRVTIVRDADGALTGHVTFDQDTALPSRYPGPYAPPTDPGVGYPTTVPPDGYWDVLTNVQQSVDYTLYDGVVRDGRLTFWWSTFDVWTDWCAMQTPQEVEIDGALRYRCADPTSTTVDAGKLALCTAAPDMGWCEDGSGGTTACVCQVDGNDPLRPLCTPEVCSCGPDGCLANLRKTVFTADFAIQGDTLVGSYRDVFRPLSLERVAP